MTEGLAEGPSAVTPEQVAKDTLSKGLTVY